MYVTRRNHTLFQLPMLFELLDGWDSRWKVYDSRINQVVCIPRVMVGLVTFDHREHYTIHKQAQSPAQERACNSCDVIGVRINNAVGKGGVCSFYDSHYFLYVFIS